MIATLVLVTGHGRWVLAHLLAAADTYNSRIRFSSQDHDVCCVHLHVLLLCQEIIKTWSWPPDRIIRLSLLTLLFYSFASVVVCIEHVFAAHPLVTYSVLPMLF
jgi:hypothetical protein